MSQDAAIVLKNNLHNTKRKLVFCIRQPYFLKDSCERFPIQYHSVLFSIIQYYSVLFSIIQYYSVLLSIIQY